MQLAILKEINLRSWSSTTRIAFALGMWAATVLLGLRLYGLLDDDIQPLLEARVKRCESIAFACAEFVNEGNHDGIKRLLSYHVNHANEILAARCVLNERDVYRSEKYDANNWQDNSKGSSLTCIRIPIRSKTSTNTLTAESGSVDITFTPPIRAGFIGFLDRKSIRITLAASALNLFGFLLITRRCFRDLDPSQVVPERVRSAFDTMAEMVIVLDEYNRVVLTNRSFAERVKSRNIQGQHVDSLPWDLPHDTNFSDLMQGMLDGETGERTVSLQVDSGELCTIKPNVSVITDDAGQRRGYLVSLDDITVLEKRTNQLQVALSELQTSQRAIEEKNERLTFLATRDPMTGCLNRRAFFEKMNELWKTTRRYRHPLACVMIDVDHFKSVNDTYGHAMGDEVLIKVATALVNTVRETDYVCRYGGEEFCVLLPHIDIEGVAAASERFRMAIEGLEFEQLSVTVSLGCSSVEFGADQFETMIAQADQALYAAKEHGRNRVVRFDQIATVESDGILTDTKVESIATSGHSTPQNAESQLSSIDELFAAAEV